MATINYSCPNCGGKLVFDAGKQKFSCEWCLSDFTQEDLDRIFGVQTGENGTADKPPETMGNADDASQDSFSGGTNLYICDSCGAEIIAEENTAATFCFYCHSPVALSGRLSGSYCPQKVIPFKKTKEQAIGGFKEWCGKKWFLPNSFTSDAQLEKITGLYVPFWIADCRIKAHLEGEARIVTTTRTSSKTITHTKLFNVERSAETEYKGVPADASKKLDDALMDSIEPFDYNELVKFSMSYLQGFYADKYDVEKKDLVPRIKKRITEGATQLMLDDIKGYTTVSPRQTNVDLLNTDWHYIMLPVWFMSYDYKGKKYFYAMNGQTGKFSGFMPVSTVKSAFAGLIAALITFLIVLGIGAVVL